MTITAQTARASGSQKICKFLKLQQKGPTESPLTHPSSMSPSHFNWDQSRESGLMPDRNRRSPLHPEMPVHRIRCTGAALAFSTSLRQLRLTARHGRRFSPSTCSGRSQRQPPGTPTRTKTYCRILGTCKPRSRIFS